MMPVVVSKKRSSKRVRAASIHRMSADRRRRRRLQLQRQQRLAMTATAAGRSLGKVASEWIELNSTIRSQSVHGPRVVESTMERTEAEVGRVL